ncbi:unnamed protein product [Vitrella brassicaformis CCMP3155]|uniref:Glutaredoxin domain-containing protein n=1 Tax=Vitrella brassicaformis (strain CCMP3155) TaxID=1169540 RepID=A0A0G4F8M2_VITBC|nr:unnamed protein product [Vitrella brassicaformis CCMP3155]|mmetsp:Transcript_32749/g.81128  ORF Transcript_32749/g.81128 Transcript_32749/m.81128 type:complete len:227 (-) Transcript_32749:130-810(-)|eukprot:CEM09053.1 unnamed protein product [Vitrella brassicaformis CCMP3155]
MKASARRCLASLSPVVGSSHALSRLATSLPHYAAQPSALRLSPFPRCVSLGVVCCLSTASPGSADAAAAKSEKEEDSGTNGESHPDFAPQPREIDWDKIKDKIRELLTGHRMVLFMKGSPDQPQCGFSSRVVMILDSLGMSDYTFVDVLKHPIVREGIKKYSDWPTIPQLYIDGEFLGGCDIIMQLYQSGELKQTLLEKGFIKTAEGGGDTEGGGEGAKAEGEEGK